MEMLAWKLWLLFNSVFVLCSKQLLGLVDPMYFIGMVQGDNKQDTGQKPLDWM